MTSIRATPSPIAWCTRAEENGPPAMAVQEVELPERVRPIERLREMFLDRRRERRVVAGRRYALLDEVAVEIEVGVVRPHQFSEVGLVARHALAETADLRQALGERLRGLLPGDLARQWENAVDVHQVRRIVHPQPGDVDRGERRALFAAPQEVAAGGSGARADAFACGP